MEQKRIIIMGATSGIGREVAFLYIQRGWRVGIAGRRKEELTKIQEHAPSHVEIAQIDVTQEDADLQLLDLVKRLGGMDIYFHSSGIGKQNRILDKEVEIRTLRTNGEGFVRMVDAAFNYFRAQGQGHIAVISSIAGTKGLGAAPAYSATKRFQSTYIQSLVQLSRIEHTHVRFTDIRPGFVATDLLSGSYNYPMMLSPDRVAVEIVQALDAHKRVKVIDWKYAILTCCWRLLPNWIWERLSVK